MTGGATTKVPAERESARNRITQRHTMLLLSSRGVVRRRQPAVHLGAGCATRSAGNTNVAEVIAGYTYVAIQFWKGPSLTRRQDALVLVQPGWVGRQEPAARVGGPDSGVSRECQWCHPVTARTCRGPYWSEM